MKITGICGFTTAWSTLWALVVFAEMSNSKKLESCITEEDTRCFITSPRTRLRSQVVTSRDPPRDGRTPPAASDV